MEAAVSSPVLTSGNQVEALVKAYTSRPGAVYFDTETTGLTRRNKLVAIQLKQDGRQSKVIDARDKLDIPALLRPIFERRLIVGHNLKFDLGFMRRHGVKASVVFDTQIAQQLILGIGLSESNGRAGLEQTAAMYGEAVSKDERGWFYTPAPLDERPEEWEAPFPADQISYMEQDVDVLPAIMAGQLAKLKSMGLVEVFKIEMRCLLALVEMEHAGIFIDVVGWREFITIKEAEAKRLENEALALIGPAILKVRIESYDREVRHYEAYRTQVKQAEAQFREEWGHRATAGTGWGEFKQEQMAQWRADHPAVGKPKLDTSVPDIGSTTQLVSGLLALGVAVPTKKNLKGNLVNTTESKSLESVNHPVVKLLLEYRKNAKFVQSFGESLLAHVDPKTGRIHSDYQQIGAGTGRMSCVRPNFQQIPSKGDGKIIRGLVKAKPGCVMLTADFSNIELRILANISKDPAMCAAFNAGLDLHSETARRMFNLKADVDPKTEMWKRDLSYRQIAKIINFMLIYGGSPFKLSKEIGIEVQEAEALVLAYFKAYPGVKTWMMRTKREGLDSREARTLAGRYRPLVAPGPEPHYNWEDFHDKMAEWKKLRGRAERQALNTPIQGTSADITKLALAIFSETVDPKLGRLVACVHDEIVVECVQDERAVLLVGRTLRESMKAACDAYLKFSPVPEPEVEVADHWSKG
jgi:DNA polymerase-1